MRVETPASILAFWFGTQRDDAAVAAQQSPLWWRKRPETDRIVRERFASTLADAARRALDHWAAQPDGRLALILLTDQFPRMIHRGTPAAFAHDALAREWCVAGLARGDDRALRPIERAFFYLPLEHSESDADQERAVALFEALAASADAASRAVFDGFADYARRHRDVVARFGRFPHRNAVLGRTSTAAERAFLERPGSSF